MEQLKSDKLRVTHSGMCDIASGSEKSEVIVCQTSTKCITCSTRRLKAYSLCVECAISSSSVGETLSVSESVSTMILVLDRGERSRLFVEMV